jgi:hypothetical protein
MNPRSYAMSAQDGMAMVPSAYDKIDNVSEFVNHFGKAIFDSKMFPGCRNIAQGQVLAMACIAERVTPLKLASRYHFIGGALSMKSDVMLAEFRQRGGDHTLIARTPDVAEVELRIGKGRGAKCHRFKFTWEEAKVEAYVRMQDGKTLKENWSTPRRRMQMLWARLISDSVRVMCPEVNAGQYTPEELGGTVADTEPEPIDVECEVVEEPTEPFDAAADGIREARDKTGTISHAQCIEMARLRGKLGLPDKSWAMVIGKFGVTTVGDLTYDHADRVVAWLLKRETELAQQDQLSTWANEQVKAAAGPEGE